jgi:peptide/nickel transport system permease protein
MTLGYLLRRLPWMITVLWAITVVVFLLWKLVPGDPARSLLGLEATQQHVETLRKEMALDKPFYVQYYSYVKRLWRLDLGNSYRTRQPVSEDIARFLPATLELALATMLVYVMLSVPLGILIAVHKGRSVDILVRSVVTLGAGAPVFWAGILLQMLFFYHLGWLPIAGRFDIGLQEPHRVTGMLTLDSLLARDMNAFWIATSYMALPVLASVVSYLAVGVKVTRAMMVETLEREFIRTARAKGLREHVVLYKHALRNAMIPIVTAFGVQFGYLLGGAVVVETVFAWPGLGRYAVGSITSLDIPAILGVTLVISLTFLVMNLLVDVLYVSLDPRIRFE